jgi:FkbM family methyltransferase
MPADSHFLRAAISRSSGLRTAVKSRPAQWTIQTARGASALRPAPRFIASQFRSMCVRSYRLRGSGLSVTLRHRSRDVAILNEIFGGTGGINCYAPPDDVGAWLDGLGSPQVLDLGANIGLFGLYVFGRWPTARLTGFEPDPNNAVLLRHTISANNLAQQWTISGSACSNRAGTVRFVAGRLSESRIADRDEVGTIEVGVVDLFAEDHDVDLMKIDIEGAEWSILADSRLRDLKARALVLEWHAGGCPEADPRAAATRLLRAAGYTHTLDVGDTLKRTGTGVTWAWRPEIATQP